MNLDRRLNALEWYEIRRLAAEAGRPYGLTADEVLDEARALLALLPSALPRELDRLEAMGGTDVDQDLLDGIFGHLRFRRSGQ